MNVVAVNTTGINGTVYARKEVILSAGAYQTPQLLELSGKRRYSAALRSARHLPCAGIGDKSILGNLGIESLIDLPGVGENLQVLRSIIRFNRPASSLPDRIIHC